MNSIPDIQSSRDLRNIPINHVGIKDLRLPVRIRSREGVQHSVASLTMTVSLPAEQKGTHMSRFVALMEQDETPLDWAHLRDLCRRMLEMLEAENGRISASLPFFRRKTAPVSGIQSYLDYQLTLSAERENGQERSMLKMLVPVTSLCPCSKQISQYGAHNQRSHVTLTLVCRAEVAPEEVADWVEEQASCQLYGLLKRPDEKYVTERAYENPKFVEDMVRDIAALLRADDRIEAFTVESENFESIHNHSAYALVAYP